MVNAGVPDTLDKESAVHAEHAEENALAILSAQVQYDNGRIKDLVRSPYVFGAAMLASFGGFSFGYGKQRLPQGCKCSCSDEPWFRPRCHLIDPSHGPVPRDLPRDLSR